MTSQKDYCLVEVPVSMVAPNRSFGNAFNPISAPRSETKNQLWLDYPEFALYAMRGCSEWNEERAHLVAGQFSGSIQRAIESLDNPSR